MVSTAAHDAGDPGSNPLAATHFFYQFLSQGSTSFYSKLGYILAGLDIPEAVISLALRRNFSCLILAELPCDLVDAL